MADTVTISDSILTSIKKQLNIAESYHAFDSDIMFLINSSFSVLNQLGVGPDEGFSIEDDSAEWSSFISDDRLRMTFEYVYLKVRLSFDPPNGSVLNSMENRISELEWRLVVASEEVKNDNGN